MNRSHRIRALFGDMLLPLIAMTDYCELKLRGGEALILVVRFVSFPPPTPKEGNRPHVSLVREGEDMLQNL
jgi:hypothetical protein